MRYIIALLILLSMYLHSCNEPRVHTPVSCHSTGDLLDIPVFGNSEAAIADSLYFKTCIIPVFMGATEQQIIDTFRRQLVESIAYANDRLDRSLTVELHPYQEWSNRVAKYTIKDLAYQYQLRQEVWIEQEPEFLYLYIMPDKWEQEGFLLNGFVPGIWEGDVYNYRLCGSENHRADNEIYLSYGGLANGKTFLHELGHKFFLKHCDCCSKSGSETCWSNSMNSTYSPCDNELTAAQLDTIWSAIPFRECIIYTTDPPYLR